MPVSRLYDLQQIDSALARAEVSRARLDDGAAQRAALCQADERLVRLREHLAGCQRRLDLLDLEVRSLQAKRARVEADLYSGRIGNPKELAALEAELGVLQRHQAGLEDEVLRLLVEVDRLRSEIRAAEQALDEARDTLARHEDEFRRAAAAADEEIVRLSERRAAVAAEVEADLMRRYDLLRDRKAGIAVVAVVGGVCQGCHVAVPERLVRRLEQDPEHLAACDGCGRLLTVR